MADPVEQLRVLNQRIVSLTWRGVKLTLVVVALSALSLAVGTYHRPFPASSAFTGIIAILSAGQLRIAQGQFGRLTPAQPRTWLHPLAYGLYVAGAVVLAFSLFAAIRR